MGNRGNKMARFGRQTQVLQRQYTAQNYNYGRNTATATRSQTVAKPKNDDKTITLADGSKSKFLEHGGKFYTLKIGDNQTAYTKATAEENALINQKLNPNQGADEFKPSAETAKETKAIESVANNSKKETQEANAKPWNKQTQAAYVEAGKTPEEKLSVKKK